MADVLFGPEHVKRYIETDGEVGHEWQGVNTLLLTTTGRRSGEERTHPLIYRKRGDDYLVVGSKGGWPKPPAWLLNLESNPDVQVQVMGERFPARARVATPEEKPELWKHMAEIWPAYDDYQARTDRVIPVVVLTPATTPSS